MVKKKKSRYRNEYKEKVMKIVEEKNMFSMMNNTKWKKLQNEVEDLSFPPFYIIKYVIDKSEKNLDYDVGCLGDWTDEHLTPFFGIEYIKVRPRLLKHQGFLIEPLLIDKTKDFVDMLEKNNIPFEEENGTYIIYGYKCP